MIIGNGMIAKAFVSSQLDKQGIFIFASGVANSATTNKEDFLREKIFLIQYLKKCSPSEIFLYFGTCSIYDPSAQLSDYVKHKVNMENIVLAHSAGMVIRLPQVAGPGANAHTLLRFLCNRISEKKEFNVWKKMLHLQLESSF